MYRKRVHPTIKLDYPNASLGEISKMTSKKWTSFPASVKEDWEEIAEKERAKHPNPMIKRRAASAYNLYTADKFAQKKIKDPNSTVPINEWAEEWKGLSSKEKGKWNAAAGKLKLEFAKANPKRAPSAYNEYFKKRHAELTVERPSLTPPEIMKIVGPEWKKFKLLKSKGSKKKA
jgi:hypothetical protein